jgi:ACT domain-containing protein
MTFFWWQHDSRVTSPTCNPISRTGGIAKKQWVYDAMSESMLPNAKLSNDKMSKTKLDIVTVGPSFDITKSTFYRSKAFHSVTWTSTKYRSTQTAHVRIINQERDWSEVLQKMAKHSCKIIRIYWSRYVHTKYIYSRIQVFMYTQNHVINIMRLLLLMAEIRNSELDWNT